MHGMGQRHHSMDMGRHPMEMDQMEDDYIGFNPSPLERARGVRGQRHGQVSMGYG